MKRWQSLLFIILTNLLIFKSSVSQTTVFSDTILKKAIIKIDPENPGNLENYFLKELSRGVGKNPKKVNYTIDYQITTSIVLEKADASYWIMTDVLINKISGDIFFRDFTLESYLAPSIAIVKITFANFPGLYIDTVQVTPLNSGRNFLPPDPCRLNGILYPFSFETEQIECKLNYDNSDFTHFNNQIKNRQDYYVSNAIIDTAFQLLFSLSDHNQPLLSSFFHVIELEHLLYHLKNKVFISDLNLEKYDPLKFLQKINNLSYRYELARKDLEEKARNVEGGPDKLQLNKFYDDYIFQFLKYLTPSYHTDFYSRESFYQLGSVIYRKNQLADDARLFLKIAFNTRMNYYSGQILQTISDAIYDAWLEQADSSIIHQKYNDALVILQNAENFCHQSPYTFCDHNLFQKQARAKYGMYDSFLTVATKALQSGNSQMATNFINRAWAYQKSNKEFIISDLKVKKLNDSLVAQNLLRAQNSYPELSEQYRDYDSIESLIKKNADSLLHIERRIKLSDLISSGRVKVWGNELYKAKRIRKESLLLAKSYFLDKDSTIQEALHGLDTLILFKKCFDISLDYDNKMQATKQAISNKNFIKVNQILQEVGYIISNNPECNISDTLVNALLATYKPAIKYQKNMVEIENALEEKNYKEVFLLYNQTDELYDSQNLYLFGITHKPKRTFITESNDPGLLLFALNASIMNGKGQEGFSILQRMRDIGMDKEKLKSQQQETGYLMAAEDHNKGIKTDPNVTLAGYTEGCPWFKIFTKNYMKKLKELSGKKNLFYF